MKKMLTIFFMFVSFVFITNMSLQAQQIGVSSSVSGALLDTGTDAQGTVEVGVQFTITYTLSETAGTDLDVTAFATASETNCSIGTITPSIPFTATLNSGGTASMTVDVPVTVTAAGAFSFEIDISNTDADAADQNFDITVSGTGVVITPADNAVGVSIQPVFQWVSQATGIVVSTNASYDPSTDTPEDWEIEQTGLSNVTSFDVTTLTTTLLNNTTYYWWVEISSVWTLMGDFITTQNITPYLVSPIAGAQLSVPTVQLNWSATGSGLLYDVFYSSTQKTTYAGDAGALQFTDLSNPVVSVAGLAPGVEYFWQVRAKNISGVIVGYSTVESFVTYGILSEPVLTYPLNGSDTYTVDPYLYWTNYAYSTFIQYKVRYGTSSAMTGDQLTTATETSLSYDLYRQLSGLDNGTTYYWQAAATNDGGTTFAWSNVFSFNTPASTSGGSTLLPPTPSYPTGGVLVYSSSVTMYWQVSDYSGTLQYQVRYAEANTTDGTGMLNDVSAISLPMTSDYFKQVAGLEGDMTYYWQVRAYNGSSFSDWSAVDNFQTDVSVLSVQTPVLLTPGDGELVQTLQPTLFWYVSGVPSGYDFTVVYNTDGAQDGSGNLTGTSNVLGSGTTNGFFAQFASTLSNGQTYYWQVIGTKSSISKYSAVRSFTVNTQAAAATTAPIPIPTSPTGGQTVNTTDPVLSWAVNSSYTNLEFEVLYSTDGTTSGGVLTNGTTATSWGTNLAVTIPGLTPGATYYWQVRSRLASSPSTVSDYSAVENFVVSASAGPVMAILGSPIGGVEIASVDPVLSWVPATQTSSALTYEIEIAEDPTMTTAQVIEDVTATNYRFNNLPAGKTYYWRVRSKSVEEGNYSYFTGNGEFAINANITDVEPETGLPTEFELSQNYPNPFNPSTNIRFSINEASNITLKIYDILGRELVTLVNEAKQAGTFNVTWNGVDSHGNKVSSGTYIYRLVAGNNVETKKMILIK